MSKVVFAQIHRESVDWLGPAPGLGAELDPLVKTNIIVNWKFILHRQLVNTNIIANWKLFCTNNFSRPTSSSIENCSPGHLRCTHSIVYISGENGHTQVDKAQHSTLQRISPPPGPCLYHYDCCTPHRAPTTCALPPIKKPQTRWSQLTQVSDLCAQGIKIIIWSKLVHYCCTV